MKNVVFGKDGIQYHWVIRGMDEEGCAADIKENMRTYLTDYVATMFAEQYGCVAECEQARLMSHNQYQAFLQKNANRLSIGDGYTIEDYQRDAASVVVLPFRLEQFHLSPAVEEFINKRFASISYTPTGDACLRCHINSSVNANFMADELGCEMVCNQGFSGFYKNDMAGLILEFCDGDVSLLVCSSQKSYAAHLAEFNAFYEIENCDICLEIYFDNVHMDNLFLPRENVGMAISSLLQRGYDGYDENVKARWQEYLVQHKTPSLSFRAVEAPSMVRDLDFVLAVRKQPGIEEVLSSATERAAMHENSADARNVERELG